MTQIKQKQGGTELQDINFYFILHLIYYPLYCVLYLACFPFILYAYYGWFKPSSVICDDPSTMPLDVSWFMLICA